MYFFELLEWGFSNAETTVDLLSDGGKNPVWDASIGNLSFNLTDPVFVTDISWFHGALLEAVSNWINPAIVEIQFANWLTSNNNILA